MVLEGCGRSMSAGQTARYDLSGSWSEQSVGQREQRHRHETDAGADQCRYQNIATDTTDAAQQKRREDLVERVRIHLVV